MKTKIPTLLFLILIFSIYNCEKSKDYSMVLFPVSEDPTISFRLWFKAGSQDDPAGKSGLAALTARMVSESSTQKHSYEEILDILYPIAASINSQVDKEMTIIYGRTHKDNLEAFYNILKEIVTEPAFKKEDFTRIKSDQKNYIEKTLRYADDEEFGKELLSEFIFRDTPYEHIEEGHISSLDSIGLEDVKSFYKKYYTYENLVFGLGGGYPAELPEKIREDFQVLPGGKPLRKPIPQPESIEGLEILILEKGANATAISFGFPIDVLRGERDYYALAIANSWFGEHRNSSSHLYQLIRETRGLNYGDYSYIEHFPYGGRRQFPPPNVGRRQQVFQVWIRPVPNNTRLFTFRAAQRELEQLIENGMSTEDFELTRKFLKNYLLHYAPTTMMKLGYAIDDVFYGIDGSHLDRFQSLLEDITLEEVNAAIKSHLRYKDMKVIFVTANAGELKEELMNNVPSPITYENPKPPSVLEEDKKISTYPIHVTSENVKIMSVDEAFQ